MSSRRRLLQSLALSLGSAPAFPQFRFAPADSVSRTWIGPDFWANPLQDWRLREGRMECFVSGGDRNLFLLTREITAAPGSLLVEVELGRLPGETGPLDEGWAGLRVGVRGNFEDYRDDALFGRGLHCGVTTAGRLFIGEPSTAAPATVNLNQTLHLRLAGAGGTLTLAALDAAGNKVAEVQRTEVPADWIRGGIALVCSRGPAGKSPQRTSSVDFGFAPRPGVERGGNVRFWFRNLSVSGTRTIARPERAWGPLLFNQFTISHGVLKMTVQLAPVNETETKVELRLAGRPPVTASLDRASETATFRILNWAPGGAVPYEVRYRWQGGLSTLTGTLPADPVLKQRLTIGALTCQGDFGYPHNPIAKNLRHLRPDILFFTGDQLYERNGDYGIQRAPAEAARLDYLRKWFLFGWAWGDLTLNTPCVCLPDDHDVYHGNLWGAGGRKAEGVGQPGQDSGGYVMPAEWVNIVQRTQTSHLPDPADPTPVDQNISVHYCHLRWGGISFAVLEDRKWKTAPRTAIPDARIINGWPQNVNWKGLDAPGASLLGERQERFLEDWAKDWSGGAWIKAVVSATIFCNVATLPAPATTDAVTGSLPVLAPGEYGQGEVPTMDHDSNAWPQHGRNAALRSMRKAAAFHIAGDQHLGSTIQYGIDDWNDAGFAICTPAISNIFPRRWFPPQPGRHPLPHSPRNTGEFLDGFGNRMTVHAVANPMQFGVLPTALNNRAPGFGVIRIDRATREIEVTNWPRWADIAAGHPPYPGWPVRIRQFDNGLPRSGWTLPAVTVPTSGPQPVAEVSSAGGDVLYSIRLTSGIFAAPVPGPGIYSLRLYDPDRGTEKRLERLTAIGN